MIKAFFLSFFLSCSMLGWAQQSLEDSLVNIINQGNEDEKTIVAYNQLSYEYSRKNVNKAKSYLNSAIALSKKINYQRGLSNAYSMLVYLNHDLGRPDSAEYYLNRVLDLANRADPSLKDVLFSNYYSTAALYYKKTGDYTKAIPFFEKSIALNVKTGNKESTAGQSLNLGNTLFAMGKYEKSTVQHLKALRIFEEIGNQRGISFCYQSLSSTFTNLKQYKNALEYANKSIKIKKSLKDFRGIGTAESGLGAIYEGLGDFKNAISHYLASLNIAKEQKDLPQEQGNYFNLAKIYISTKENDLAIDFLKKSRILASQLKDSSSVASIDAELIALQSGNTKDLVAETKLKSSMALFEERGDLNRKADNFKNMSDFYSGTKQFEKALEYNKKYYLILDSIRSNELQILVQKNEELYIVEKKEKEIAILKKNELLNQSRLQRQKIIQFSLALLIPLFGLVAFLSFNRYKLRSKMKELEMRNQIAADLHDEVGSSLSSINILSQMVATKTEANPAEKEMLITMSTNARETIDKMSDIVWMIKSGKDDGESLKQRMERFLYEICSAANIRSTFIATGLENIKLSLQQKKDIYLVFKEALNNAVKYSCSKQVYVTTIVEDKNLKLTVKDEGVGFEIENFSEGNGLQNMRNRAKEIGGELVLNSEKNKGTMVQLVVPL